MQQRLEQRIVSTAEHENVRIAETVGKGLTHVNTGNLLSDGVLDPSFFDQRDQQRASLLARIKAPSLKCFPVGVAADRGLGPDNDDFLILADGSGGLSRRALLRRRLVRAPRL